jgi:hypothetical protein
MPTTIRQVCRNCGGCKRNKGNNSLPLGLLQPLPIPEYPWQAISEGLVTDLPTCCHHDCILVVIDGSPSRKTVTAPQFSQWFFDTVLRRFGMPTDIVSDRDPRSTSIF